MIFSDNIKEYYSMFLSLKELNIINVSNIDEKRSEAKIKDLGLVEILYLDNYVSIIPAHCIEDDEVDLDCVKRFILKNLDPIREIFMQIIEKTRPLLSLITAIPLLSKDLLIEEEAERKVLTSPGKELYSIYFKNNNALLNTPVGKVLISITSWGGKDILVYDVLPLEVKLALSQVSLSRVAEYYLKTANKIIEKIEENILTKGDLLIHFKPIVSLDLLSQGKL